MYSKMVCASAPLSDHRFNCRRRSSSSSTEKKPRPNLPPTAAAAGNVSNGGAPLKLHSKLQKSKLHIWVCRGRSSANNIFNWGMWDFKWVRCFIVPWSWTSRMVSVYLLCVSFAAEAHGIPDHSFGYSCENVQSYYAGMEHLRGEALKQKLNSTIARHQSLSYKEVWDALKILDAADVDRPEASSEVVEIYSLRVVSKLLAGKPEGWNREHLWPRSYGLINGPSLTDLHNIRPADVNVNSSRGNKFYGECHVNKYKCRKPATRESASDTETDKERWAPPKEVRGDIARAIMYMAVCYGVNKSGGSLHLHLSDSPSIANREMGMLSSLLKWNEVDPPSREEKLRNERICIKYQHNRNPFVDHPEYANFVWKQEVQRH